MNKIKAILSFQSQQDIKLKIQIALFYFIAMLLIFTLFRLMFCIAYADTFQALSFCDKAASFVYGLRFDVATISMFLGGFIIILFLPYPKKSTFIKVCAVGLSISALIMLLMLSADFFYFPEVKRHMTEDIILAWRDKDFIVKYALKYYFWVLVFIFALMVFAIRKIFKFIDKRYNPKSINLCKSICVLILVVMLVIFGRRSNFSGMPLNLSDAYNIQKKSENIQLILNGVFTQYYYLKGTNDTKGVIANNYPAQQAFKNSREFLLSSNEFFPDDKYPLMRQIKIPEKKPDYNIIIVLLESWTPKYIDSFNGNKGYGVTPNFDNIAENGIKFNNAYSAGPRSQFGLISSLVGMQIVPGTVYYYGFDMMNRFTKVASVFNNKGYFTMYAQSSERNSIMMCSVAQNMLDFSESYGQEDFPRLMNYYKYYNVYDYDMLGFVSKKAGEHHKKGQPFFIYSFTGTTHIPFNPIADEFNKYPLTSLENKYLNSLYYADYSIGHLIDNAKKDGYFDNTIFVFMADHIYGGFALQAYDTKERFRIPFVVYAPKILKPQQIDYTVSQADLIPSIYHLMGIEEPFTAVGTNIFDKSANHFALICDGMNIVFIDGQNYVSSNRIDVVKSSIGKNDEKYELMTNTLLFLDKAITESIKYNKWYRIEKETSKK